MNELTKAWDFRQNFTEQLNGIQVMIQNKTGPQCASSGMSKPEQILPLSPFTNMGITLIPAWISNHIHNKIEDEITYPFWN